MKVDALKTERMYYTPKEVAAMLGFDYWTILRWMKSGKLEAVKIGKGYRISKESLEKLTAGE